MWACEPQSQHVPCICSPILGLSISQPEEVGITSQKLWLGLRD